MWALGQNISWN